jgi:PTH1 family peptidyl-tRNA hydrolase
MKMIAGLGNPGREYAKTRHNLGFMVVDELARRAGTPAWKQRFKAELTDIVIDGEKVILVKPQTYMNLSGHAIREAAAWFKIPRQDVLVVLDELDIPFGAIRMRQGGSAGGHNGLKSINEQLGGQDIPRLRVGIGRGHGVATAQVLSRFSAEEERELPMIIDCSADCAGHWVTSGIIDAMNRCNRNLLEAPKPDPKAAAE